MAHIIMPRAMGFPFGSIRLCGGIRNRGGSGPCPTVKKRQRWKNGYSSSASATRTLIILMWLMNRCMIRRHTRTPSEVGGQPAGTGLYGPLKKHAGIARTHNSILMITVLSAIRALRIIT